MYTKYNTFRFITTVIIFSFFSAIVVYQSKNKISSIKGSRLEFEFKKLVMSNPKIQAFLK